MKRLLCRYFELPLEAKATFWLFISSLLQRSISFLTTPLFTRLMAEEQYGRYNIYLSWVNILTILVSLNLYHSNFSAGLMRYENDRGGFTASQMGLGSVATIVGFFVYLLFHNQLNSFWNLTTLLSIAMFVEILFSSIYMLWATHMRFDFRYKPVALVTMSMAIANPLIGFIAVSLSRHKMEARALSWVFIQAIFGVIIILSVCVKKNKFYHAVYWVYGIKHALPLLVHNLGQKILNQSDKIMIGMMVGAAESGVYSLGNIAASIMQVIVFSVNQAVNPVIYKHIKMRNIRSAKALCGATVILVGSLCVCVCALAPELVFFLAPPAFHSATWVISPLVCAGFLFLVFNFVSIFAFYFERGKYVSYSTVVGAVLNVVLNFIAIKIFGYLAAGYTTLLCQLIMCLTGYFFMRKICRTKLTISDPIFSKGIFAIIPMVVLVCVTIPLLYSVLWLRIVVLAMLLMGLLFSRNRIVKMLNVGFDKNRPPEMNETETEMQS